MYVSKKMKFLYNLKFATISKLLFICLFAVSWQHLNYRVLVKAIFCDYFYKKNP